MRAAAISRSPGGGSAALASGAGPGSARASPRTAAATAASDRTPKPVIRRPLVPILKFIRRRRCLISSCRPTDPAEGRPEDELRPASTYPIIERLNGGSRPPPGRRQRSWVFGETSEPAYLTQHPHGRRRR